MSETASFPIVDAHQHFWNLEQNYYPWLRDLPMVDHRYGDYSAVKTTYLPPDYRRETGRNDIVGTVHVQADWNPADPVAETRWLSALAASEGLPSACVAHVDLDSPDAAQVMSEQASFALVRGVRDKPAASAGAARGALGSMDDPAWRRGYELLAKHGLSFDLQTPWWHLDAARDLAADFPATTTIINHAGLPSDRAKDALVAWRAALDFVAQEKNVAIKISGLGQAGRAWTVESNGPLIRDIVAIFGAERCMFGSNFPVDRLIGDFDGIVDGIAQAIAHLTPADRRKIFHDNACRIYRLDLPSASRPATSRTPQG